MAIRYEEMASGDEPGGSLGLAVMRHAAKAGGLRQPWNGKTELVACIVELVAGVDYSDFDFAAGGDGGRYAFRSMAV